MAALFGGIRAPSTLGSFLRSFTWGNVLQLEKVSRALLADLARRAPLLHGRDTVAFVDMDSIQGASTPEAIPLSRRATFGPGFWAFLSSFAAAVSYGVHWLAAEHVRGVTAIAYAALAGVLTAGSRCSRPGRSPA